MTFAVSTGLAIASTRYGIGMHIVDLGSVDFVYANKLMTISQFFALISIAIAKSSFCVTLLRLAPALWHKIFIYSVLITVNLMLWLCAIFLFTTCTPVEKKWNFSIPGRCGDFKQQMEFAIFIAGACFRWRHGPPRWVP